MERGRCVGHSAIPVFEDPDPYAVKYPQVRLDSDVRLAVSDQVYDHGFALLTLNAYGSARADYFSVSGDAVPGDDVVPKRLFSETF